MESSKVYILRHGERLDEADKDLWRRMCLENENSKRSIDFLINDPPLTEVGHRQAMDAAQTIYNILSTQQAKIDRIYSSKLVRAYQTAMPLAKLLNIPIYVSSGLALTAEAVRKYNGNFQFLTIDEIRLDCPAVEIIDADIDGLSVGPDWMLPISMLSAAHPISIIVGHRETIRNVIGKHIPTPYCCMATFIINNGGPLQFSNLIDKDGTIIS